MRKEKEGTECGKMKKMHFILYFSGKLRYILLNHTHSKVMKCLQKKIFSKKSFHCGRTRKKKNSLEMKMYCKEVVTNLRRPKSSLMMNFITSFCCIALFPDYCQFLAQKFCLASQNLGRKVRRLIKSSVFNGL